MIRFGKCLDPGHLSELDKSPNCVLVAFVQMSPFDICEVSLTGNFVLVALSLLSYFMEGAEIKFIDPAMCLELNLIYQFDRIEYYGRDARRLCCIR